MRGNTETILPRNSSISVYDVDNSKDYPPWKGGYNWIVFQSCPHLSINDLWQFLESSWTNNGLWLCFFYPYNWLAWKIVAPGVPRSEPLSGLSCPMVNLVTVLTSNPMFWIIQIHSSFFRDYHPVMTKSNFTSSFQSQRKYMIWHSSGSSPA